MAIGHIVTLGFGNGTFAGSIANVVTLGYSAGAAAEVVAVVTSGGGGRAFGPQSSVQVLRRPLPGTRDEQDMEVLLPVMLELIDAVS